MVPSRLPSAGAGGPTTPAQEDRLRISGVIVDPGTGKRTVIVKSDEPGGSGTVLQVGDRWQGWLVESITQQEMVVLGQDADGQPRRRTIKLQTGSTRGPGASAAPPTGGAQPASRRPGGNFPGTR